MFINILIISTKVHIQEKQLLLMHIVNSLAPELETCTVFYSAAKCEKLAMSWRVKVTLDEKIMMAALY